MKDRIMRCAVEEIRNKGLKFTMSDLARRMGVSKRSLYMHFESKENLVSSIVEALLEDIYKQRILIVADTQLDYPEKLKKLIITEPVLFAPMEGSMIIEIKRFLHVKSEKIEQMLSENWKVIEEFLQIGVNSGQLRSIYIPVLEKMVRGTKNEIINYHFLAENNVSLNQASAYMVDILIYGMIPQKYS